jgi:predicted Zn-dependent protease
MSNGSTKSREGSPLGLQRLRSRALLRCLVCGLVATSACGHAMLPASSDLRNELAAVTAEELFASAMSHASAGDLLRAEQYLSAAKHRGYDHASIVSWLVRVCVASSRYRSALSHSDDYLRDNPSDWPLRLVVASIHEALGNSDLAQVELERVVEARPDAPLPHYRLAMLYGRHEATRTKASDHLQEYLRLDPAGPHSAEARAVLSEGPSAFGATLGPRRMRSHAESSSMREASR